MASLNLHQYFTTTTTLLIIMVLLLHHLLCPISCFYQSQPSISPRNLLFEEKSRLGSIPPSCHNKCNQCHPCIAVQVPTLPGHSPDLARSIAVDFFDPSRQGNGYSNYKPLGWKCHCGDLFFNP